MISRTRVATLAALACAASACNTENRIEDGLTVHLAEVHLEARGDTEAATPTLALNAAGVTGGYDSDHLEKHPLRDANGTALALYRAYVVIDGLELVPCAQAPLASLGARHGSQFAAIGNRLLDALVPSAQAHAGHGSEPVGGRSLDQPNVIDIVTQEGFILPLGDKSIAPGEYCALRLALVRLAGSAYGLPESAPASNDDPVTTPEIPDLAGRMFALRADYCAELDAGACIRRERVDIDDDGLTEPPPVTLAFPQPLTVNAGLREIYVALGIAYGEWMDEVDATQLASDAQQRQRLLDNIVGSFHVDRAGLGELPPNIIE